MARPRTPTNILDARGAFSKNPQRARTDEPEAVGEVGAPPPSFTELQHQAWADITDRCHFGVLCRADSLAVEVAAVLMAEFRSNPVDIPAAKLARLDSLLSRFGMTPADRSKVSSAKRKTENRFSRNGNR